MKYKITFNAGRKNNEKARDTFREYIAAVRDGLDLLDVYLSIYPDYKENCITFEIDVTDNILELSTDKHFKFINKLQSTLYEYKHLLACEQVN